MADEIEVKEVSEVVEKPEFSEAEQRAMEQGWKPKDQFEGSEDEWRSARDFLERGEMIGKIRSQSRQIQSVEQALKSITTQNTKMYERGYNEALATLNAQKRQALADGDLVAVEDIKDRIDAVKAEGRAVVAAAAAPAKTIQGEDPEHADWLVQNPWYNNPVMQKFADALAIDLINNNKGITPAQVRVFVAKEVREEFKHRFEKDRTTGAPSPDGEGRGNRSGNGSQGLSKIESGMAETERDIMKTMIRATGMTKAEYLKQYSENR